jgi:hypothetical protein
MHRKTEIKKRPRSNEGIVEPLMIMTIVIRVIVIQLYSIQIFIIYVPSRELQDQLQT